MRQPDWIIFVGKSPATDPDMAHRPGVRNVTPTRWQRIERRVRLAATDITDRLTVITDQARIAATFAGAAIAALVTPATGRWAYV